MNSRAFIGLDPGQSGAVAWLPPDGAPETAKLADLTERDLVDLLAELRSSWPDSVALLEQVHAMPGQGVASTFKFGMSYGALRVALVAAGIPFETVTPAKWQGALRCRTGGDKRVTKARAQELFPSVKVIHAIADALLLAECCRRTWGAP